MKISFFKTAIKILRLLSLPILCAPFFLQAATLMVTPSVVSNTYSGPITFQILGLTNSEQVTIEHYLDVNANGSVNAGEFLIDAFTIADGGVSIIGGVTNINVPFDSNATGGAITTTISFAGDVESIIGQHIYRLVGPPGHFSPFIAIANVTNTAFSQSITGTVFRGGAPVANCVAVALLAPSGFFVAGAVADSGGHFLLKLPVGSYQLFALSTNSYLDSAVAPIVTLTNGATVSTNLFITNASVTISGKVYDAASSNGLGGAFVQLENDSLVAFTFTDTNGNYTAGVTSNNWSVQVDDSRLARRAYVPPSDNFDANASGGSVTNFNFPLPKANALFYGRILDGSNAPIAGVDFFSEDDQSYLFEASGISDANGNFVVAVYATNNSWSCFVSSDTTALLNYVTTQGTNTIISANQAVLVNFTALRTTARVSGKVLTYQGTPLSAVRVNGYAFTGGNNYRTTQVETDAAGNYSLGVVNGTWNINAECCGDRGLEEYGLYDPFYHFVTIPPTNVTLNIIAYPIDMPALAQPTRLSPTQFGFLLGGTPGTNYTIIASTNVSMPSSSWFTVLVTNLPYSPFFLVDTHATNSQRYYRAKLGP